MIAWHFQQNGPTIRKCANTIIRAVLENQGRLCWERVGRALAARPLDAYASQRPGAALSM